MVPPGRGGDREQSPFLRKQPGLLQNSWAKFCSIMLVLTLQRDLGVHYNVEQRSNPNLAKSKDQFIHGIVEGTGGTCASLPVLFVAVGRRLGYPLRLAQAFSHFYARWDDPATGEQFNMEGSNSAGLDFQDEDYYQQKAQEMGAGPLESGNYLKSMSPREELSSFLTTRADCLRENGRWMEAYRTYQKAVELAPQNLFAVELLRKTARTIQRFQSSQQGVTVLRRRERERRMHLRRMIGDSPRAPYAHPGSLLRTRHSTPVIPRHPGFGMHAYLQQQNRRNEQLDMYGMPGVNASNAIISWLTPMPHRPHQGSRP